MLKMKKVYFIFSILFCNAYALLPQLNMLNLAETVVNINPLKMLSTNRCIEDLGCFYTDTPFYHPIIRPISLTPSIPLTRFQLYTPSNPVVPYDLEISLESLRSSSFDPELPTKFLIHGFISDLNVGDIRHETKEALLKHGNYNVIIVDWTKNNRFPYSQAVANTRTTGAKAAKLIHFLMENTGITAESIHLIGHSLGAHVAGYIGQRVPNIGRISGLDPAGPYFQDLDPEVRLDTTDASFVDIIHTDGGEHVLNGLGMSSPIGHIDFYPNGGERQPGCGYTVGVADKIFGAAIDFTTKYTSNGCDHGRANQYFLHSINNSQCRFLAVNCNSYEDFEEGKCSRNNSTVAEMGFHAKPLKKSDLPVKFFLITKDTAPYCIDDKMYTELIATKKTNFPILGKLQKWGLELRNLHKLGNWG